MTLRFKVFIFLVLIHLNLNYFCQLASGMDQKLSPEFSNPHKKAVIRKKLAHGLSKMFVDEVPEYKEFTNIVRSSNEDFLQNNPHALIDSEDRVLSEKHGAIRVGTAFEMKTVRRIFEVAGMEPVEFYDLTTLPNNPLPMIATAFRPIDQSIDICAFRMFCSMLHPDYIPKQVRENVAKTLKLREQNNPKFSSRLMNLLQAAETVGLCELQTDEFVSEVVNSFKINRHPINFSLYKDLRGIHDVLADIICLGINLNHLTPRAYDIQDATNRLTSAGIPMKIGGIEGPPIQNNAPNIQLNQTSRIAPGEQMFVSNDETILSMFESNPLELEILKKSALYIPYIIGEAVQEYLARIESQLLIHKLVIIQHKARFGEIESRGTALTLKGENLLNTLLKENTFQTKFPKSHKELFLQELAYYTFCLATPNIFIKKDHDQINLATLILQEQVELIPQTYNDFLAASAASIFTSNLTSGTQNILTTTPMPLTTNKKFLEVAMERNICDRHTFHQKEQLESTNKILQQLQNSED